MNEKAVVLGSNSFSGAHFVNHCLNAGLTVIGISRSKEPDEIFLPYKKNADSANFEFHKLDLNHSLNRIMEVIENFKPDYVLNFAAQGMVAQSWESPTDWLMTNTVSPVRLHDQLRKCGFLRKFVQISTPEVYGHCEGPVKENSNYNPSTPYAVSKAAVDMSLMCFWKVYAFPVVFTRTANVYGSGQQPYRIIPLTILKFLTGKKLQLHGGGNSVRSFIHISDVVEATLKVAQLAEPCNIFHLSTSKNISIRSLVEIIAEMMNVSFDANVEVTGERLGKDTAYLLDSSKAEKQLDWKPKINLETGIKETIEWVTHNLDLLKTLPWTYTHKA